MKLSDWLNMAVEGKDEVSGDTQISVLSIHVNRGSHYLPSIWPQFTHKAVSELLTRTCTTVNFISQHGVYVPFFCLHFYSLQSNTVKVT